MMATGEHVTDAIARYTRDSDGSLPALDSGGYPLIYLTSGGYELCSGCATAAYDGSDSDVPISADVYWEGPDAHCAQCGKPMPAAYSTESEEES